MANFLYFSEFHQQFGRVQFKKGIYINLFCDQMDFNQVHNPYKSSRSQC